MPIHFALWFAGTPDAAHLPLAMLLVFGSAKVLHEIFERLRMPGLVGEIVAGVLIGPSVLGWMKPDPFIETLSELGVMFLLFKVGLEVKASDLMKVGGTAAWVAFLGVVIPFGAGWGILRYFGEPQIESLFMGAAMVATSVGITAQVLSSKGLLSARASKIILAAAVIDDVLGLIVLAVVSSLAAGSVKVIELGVTALMAIGFTLVIARFGTPTMKMLMPRIEERLHARNAQFVLAIILLFSLSLLAVHAGVAAIIGAFLAGVAMAETVTPNVHTLADGVAELLVPFFLAGIGLSLELKVFSDTSTLVLSGVILVAAVVSKFVGCGLGAIRLGWKDATRVGVGMSPRGEVGMVVAQLGLSLNVISQNIYGVVVFMSIATTIVAPPLLKLTYRDLIAAPSKALPEERVAEADS